MHSSPGVPRGTVRPVSGSMTLTSRCGPTRPTVDTRRSSESSAKGTDTLGLANSGFQVNNSTNRYVLRATITDTNSATKLYGFTIQYVIGKGVPGAPS